MQQFLDRSADGWKMVSTPPNTFLTQRGNFNKKTIAELRVENETIIKNETQVLDAIEKYFKDLPVYYTSASSATQEQYDSFIQELRLTKLSDEERDELEGLLTYDKCTCKQILETFPNDKSPGENGFTVEFYKCFFELLGHNLVESFNEAFEANELADDELIFNQIDLQLIDLQPNVVYKYLVLTAHGVMEAKPADALKPTKKNA